MAKRNGSSADGVPGAPSAKAREALALWGLALRYASSAVKPAAQGAVQGVKERLSAATSGEGSLKKSVDPTSTEKGGKVGDAADALLEKMGPPGKLAAKASVGSRMVERLTPGTPDAGPAEEDGEAAESEGSAGEPETSAEVEPAEQVADDAPGDGDEGDEAAAEDEDEVEPAAESEGPRDVAEPIEGHPGAEPLQTDFEHAYSEEVENYEHHDAYATPQ